MVIDPQVTTDSARTNIVDNYVLEGADVQNNNLDRLYIGNRSGGRNRAYVRFATMPTIPSGATISSATMTLHLTSGTSTGYSITAYKILADWDSSTIKWSNRPSASNNLVMAVPTYASPLQQLTYSNDSNLQDGWIIYDRTPIYHATVSTYYDMGYPVYYGESEAESTYLIDIYTQAVADRFMELLGVDITATVATYLESSIDKCKGNVDSTTIDSICEHSNTHTARDNLTNHIKHVTVGSSTLTSAFWTCHLVTSTSDDGTPEENRSISSGDIVLILKRLSDGDRYIKSTGVLMHELCHQFGAKDHYHNPDEENKCTNEDICSECNPNGRPDSCIMNSSGGDIMRDTVLCDACKQEILAHLGNHHLISTD